MTNNLVVGGNRGIGLELVRALRSRGEEVTATCRRTSPELEETGARIEAEVDVTSDDSVRGLIEGLGGAQFDRAILSAGILEQNPLGALDFESMRRQFEVNALGPLRLAAALRPCMASPSKLALITSRMGSIADNTSGGSYGYRMSKAALNAAGRSLAHDLRADGIAVTLLHPGYVRTEMTGGHGHIDPDESARLLLERIEELTLEASGSFWHANGERLSW